MSVASPFRPSPRLPYGIEDDDGDLERRLYLMPTGIVGGGAAAAAIVAGTGWPLAGDRLAFTSAAVIWRERGACWMAVAPFPEVVTWAEEESDAVARHVSTLIHRIGARQKPWAGLAAERPLVMGIVNTTPDSFSDGGRHLDPETAVTAGIAMMEAGADLIDVGGESTRPGADPVGVEEEIARVLPVIRGLRARGVPVSVDTRHAPAMAAALEAGAQAINDIAALREPGALEVAASSQADLCLMHMAGDPGTMQSDPVYDCAPLDVYDFLSDRLETCLTAGIARARIALDPGIGFGKSVVHNAQILAALPLYLGLGCPVLLGASRKRFVAGLSRGEDAQHRLGGSLTAVLAGLDAGVRIVRVHDVAETAQAVAVWRGIRAG